MGFTQLAPAYRPFEHVDDALEHAASDAADRWTEWCRRRAVELSPVASVEGLSSKQLAGSRGRAPGTFKASWRTGNPRRIGRSVTASFYSDDVVAGWIEYGTRPHVIRPKPDRAPASVTASGKPRKTGDAARLRFYVGGRVVYARLVHHPGTKGQFIVHRVAQESIPVLERFLSEELSVSLRRTA